jgi:hypothetical protein
MFTQEVTNNAGQSGLLLWNPEADRRLQKLIDICDEPLTFPEFRRRYLSRAVTGELPALTERQMQGFYNLIFENSAGAG